MTNAILENPVTSVVLFGLAAAVGRAGIAALGAFERYCDQLWLAHKGDDEAAVQAVTDKVRKGSTLASMLPRRAVAARLRRKSRTTDRPPADDEGPDYGSD